jgi:hypothetical protein
MSATSPRIVAALTGPRPVRLAALPSDPEERDRSLRETPGLTRTAAADETTPVVVERVRPSTRVAPDELDVVALEPVLDADRQQREIADGAAVPPRGPAVGRFAVFRTRHRSAVGPAVRCGPQPRAPTATACACRLASSWTVCSYRPCCRAARTRVRRVARLAVLSARAALRKK